MLHNSSSTAVIAANIPRTAYTRIRKHRRESAMSPIPLSGRCAYRREVVFEFGLDALHNSGPRLDNNKKNSPFIFQKMYQVILV